MNDNNEPPKPAASALLIITEPEHPPISLRDQIGAFLDGRTHGEGLLHALYDRALDEPIPARMRSLLTAH